MNSELKLISAALSKRAAFEESNKYSLKEYLSDQGKVIWEQITEYYNRDSGAVSIDKDLLKESIDRLYPKHSNLLCKVIDTLEDVSIPNVLHDVIETRKAAVSHELAAAFASNNPKNIDELLSQYHALCAGEVETGEESSVVIAPSVKELMASRSGDNRIPIYPQALTDRLDGGPLRGHHIVVFSLTDMGKCEHPESPIMRGDGSVDKIKNIRVGDTVMSPESKPVIVYNTTSGRGPMYEVTSTKGDVMVCKGNHDLSLICIADVRNYKKGQLVKISVEEFIKLPVYIKHVLKQWKVPLSFDEQETEFDPYIIGLWLGDGTVGVPEITNSDTEIISYLVDWANNPHSNYAITTKKYEDRAPKHYIKYKNSRYNPFKNFIRQRCYLGGEKRIPTEYLRNSTKNRLEVLAGLLDTDGYLTDECFEITTKYAGLADDITYLARSLGFGTTTTIKYLKSYGNYYRIVIRGATAEIPTKVPRKQSNKIKCHRNPLHEGITIRYVGEDDYYGISVEGGRYVRGDFTVTHNTLFVINAIRGFVEHGYTTLYCGNEDPQSDIIERFLVSLTGKTKQAVRNYPDKAEEFANKAGWNKVIWADLTPGTPTEVRGLVEEYRPDILIVDQIRNMDTKSENKTHNYETIAKSMRNIAKKYDLVSISITQAADSATGKVILGRGDIDGSNVGIPGTADAMIGIGATEEQEFDGVRTFSFAKNKIGGDKTPFQAIFNTKNMRVE